MFNIGDRVVMSATTQYPEEVYNPRGVEGTVTSIKYSESFVRWDNGNSNCGYDITDIELVNSNLVTVSELSYKDSDELDDEDKSIIENYLNKLKLN
tara:strand:- start:183 stop:470 length:288 start_codon:yes stop_codon:yes gene_type:complete